MLIEKVFRSEDLPPADRFDSWRELVGQTHAPLELRSDHWADFRSSQRLLDLGAVSVWPTTFQPLCSRRTPKLIRQSDPEGLHISLPLSGALRAVRGEEEAIYGPDSLCIVDTSRPVDIHGGDDASLHTGVGLEVPKALLPLPRNQLDQAARLRLSAQDGFGSLLAQLLTQLARGTNSYQPPDGPRLGTVVVDLLSALIAHALNSENSLTPETRQQALVIRIRAFVQQHLHDPHLTPPAIAAAHHISTSYLHRLFQQEDETVAALIRNQRLQTSLPRPRRPGSAHHTHPRHRRPLRLPTRIRLHPRFPHRLRHPSQGVPPPSPELRGFRALRDALQRLWLSSDVPGDCVDAGAGVLLQRPDRGTWRGAGASDGSRGAGSLLSPVSQAWM